MMQHITATKWRSIRKSSNRKVYKTPNKTDEKTKRNVKNYKSLWLFLIYALRIPKRFFSSNGVLRSMWSNPTLGNSKPTNIISKKKIRRITFDTLWLSLSTSRSLDNCNVIDEEWPVLWHIMYIKTMCYHIACVHHLADV